MFSGTTQYVLRGPLKSGDFDENGEFGENSPEPSEQVK